MTSSQRDGMNVEAAAGNAVQGLFIFNIDKQCAEFWDGHQWRSFCENTRWFYMPSIEISVASDGRFTRDLWLEYKKQFSNESNDVTNAQSPKPGVPTVASENAPPLTNFKVVYEREDMYYYVIGYDAAVFSNISIDANGVMSYTVNTEGVSDGTYMNIVFVVK
jgi:hypothetical protein